MTATARKALLDLRRTHALLDDEEDARRFRIFWVAAISLARAIGHILEKVDSERSTKLSLAVKEAYAQWKAYPDENQIFFEFIDGERNSVLKEYEFGYLSGHTNIVVFLDEEEASLESVDILYPLSEGPYAGEDCRDVLFRAIEWWEMQLKEIERATVI